MAHPLHSSSTRQLYLCLQCFWHQYWAGHLYDLLHAGAITLRSKAGECSSGLFQQSCTTPGIPPMQQHAPPSTLCTCSFVWVAAGQELKTFLEGVRCLCAIAT